MIDISATKDRPLDPRLNWAALSQAERDAAYDNNAAVKNSAALIAERNQLSETLRASRKAFLDIPYGDRERTKIDLYPAADKAAPCLVFLHGGYWQRNSRDVFAMLVEGVAAHGWSVAIPGYSLAPEVSLTDIVTEISQSLDWLAQNGESHTASPGPSCSRAGRPAPTSSPWRSITRASPRGWRFPACTIWRRSAIPG